MFKNIVFLFCGDTSCIKEPFENTKWNLKNRSIIQNTILRNLNMFSIDYSKNFSNNKYKHFPESFQFRISKVFKCECTVHELMTTLGIALFMFRILFRLQNMLKHPHWIQLARCLKLSNIIVNNNVKTTSFSVLLSIRKSYWIRHTFSNLKRSAFSNLKRFAWTYKVSW